MKLKVDMKNCYGIGELKKDFDFDEKNKKCYAIYASNGMMKTSFAKSFKDYSQGNSPKDEVFDRKSDFKICDDKSVELSRENVFVIESYNEKYDSKDGISNLLVNENLKEKYDKICKDIDASKQSLLKK